MDLATQGGGGDTTAAHLGSLRILKGQRLMLDAKATRTEPITEADRPRSWPITGTTKAFRQLAQRYIKSRKLIASMGLGTNYVTGFKNG